MCRARKSNPRDWRLWLLRSFLPLAILTALLGSPHALRADAPLEGTKPAQWRLVWTSDPATTATLCWSTAEAGTSHAVTIGKRGEEEKRTVEVKNNGRYDGGNLHYHQARLSDLAPETAYEVQMVSDGESSPVFFFVTAPARDRPFSLLFGGDSRSSSKTRRAVNRMMARLLAESTADDDPANDILALAHGGDYIVSGRSFSQWSQWMTDHELTVSKAGQLLPIIPTRGNHDDGPLFNEVFGLPPDDDNYYTISIGPQMTLITLNTEISASGDQAKWLEAQLQKARPQCRWLLAQYHRPAFPAVKSPGRALRYWVPLFEKYNVDLVCEADGHVIKRTVPIRNNEHDKTGVVYIGEGGLGVGQRTPKSDRWYLKSPGMASKGHHVQWLHFSRQRLDYRCILLGGKVADRYSRRPRSQ